MLTNQQNESSSPRPLTNFDSIIINFKNLWLWTLVLHTTFNTTIFSKVRLMNYYWLHLFTTSVTTYTTTRRSRRWLQLYSIMSRVNWLSTVSVSAVIMLFWKAATLLETKRNILYYKQINYIITYRISLFCIQFCKYVLKNRAHKEHVCTKGNAYMTIGKHASRKANTNMNNPTQLNILLRIKKTCLSITSSKRRA